MLIEFPNENDLRNLSTMTAKQWGAFVRASLLLLPVCFVALGVVAAMSFFCICVGCFVQYLPAILGSGDGILSKNRSKVVLGASKVLSFAVRGHCALVACS